MIGEWIMFILCAVCLITAMILFTAAALGANRFGFIMNRIHAGGIGDTLGLFLIALSIILDYKYYISVRILAFVKITFDD